MLPPSVTRAFHELAWTIVWFGLLVLASSFVAAMAARKWGRTKQSRQAIYSVVGFIGLVIAAAVMLSWLRGIALAH